MCVYLCVTLTSVSPGIDPPDGEKEKMGILALQMKEREVPHSVRTCSLDSQFVLFALRQQLLENYSYMRIE